VGSRLAECNENNDLAAKWQRNGGNLLCRIEVRSDALEHKKPTTERRVACVPVSCGALQRAIMSVPFVGRIDGARSRDRFIPPTGRGDA
jgi:hypothetical protein